MVKNMPKLNTINLPTPKITDNISTTLPYNGSVVAEKGFSLSFSCFDREHELFNLGGTSKDNVVESAWFLDLLDCLKIIGGKTIQEMKGSTYDLHPIDWDSANAKIPNGNTQLEYWQFRINKSKGRVIGFILNQVFYIVWLDPHHNLTDSEGYGKAIRYNRPCSTYECLVYENEFLKAESDKYKGEYEAAQKLLDEINEWADKHNIDIFSDNPILTPN